MLLHVCCGPCSTHVAKLLFRQYKLTGYFYNPNLWPYEEWLQRYHAFRQIVERYFIDFYPKQELSAEEYKKQHQKWLKAVEGLEKEPEGGTRCEVCYKLRLQEAARLAKELKQDIFTTTLTMGRNKKAEIINAIGKTCGLKFYEADWKKQNGFLHSVQLSKQYGLYRQNYCGCEFSIKKF